MKASILILLFVFPLCGKTQSMQTPCSGPAFELAKKFEGTWQEFTVNEEKEVLEGNLYTTFELSGCIITQRFLSPDKSFSFMSFGYVDASTGKWYETYLLSNGRVASYHWSTDGEDILTERVSEGTSGVKVRLRITFMNSDTYQVIEERSNDSGQWTKGAKTITRRVR
jgi:hypothetical protein